MTALVIYDTGFGNTAEIARVVASALQAGGDARSIGDVDPAHLPSNDLLVIGSPTHAGRPTPAMQAWLDRLPEDALENRRCATFDTRLSFDENGALRLLMRIIGFAAPRIAKKLISKHGILADEPTGFIVEGREGPLRKGERERAAAWARRLAAT